MKMKIEYIASPADAQPTGALQVVLPKEVGPLPQSHLKACKDAAKKTGAALCTAPCEIDGRIVMA